MHGGEKYVVRARLMNSATLRQSQPKTVAKSAGGEEVRGEGALDGVGHFKTVAK